ncbi:MULTISPECIES: PTS lactose/cellobiose transporter subunit IIA [Pasteurellaceae]|uniref:PTS lactose/cellobiose transporter subunit IIA n=2 Tax=Pasteurellaceae TaxID=712 RepID=A0A1H7VAP3_9PAST|nr:MULTISPECIES: PTS lactose/cellobiose transporter subunit IIA [Pasteurella]MBR0573772.1 PTS lactose/cellobiose transporter subunit IIA [Pasteurella atlantica]MDP8039708.1 PTS lactose/cellobiose transporter subunit IIA [Pasteurella atlantica]MDP8041893.1 PTS lactose/cellobiose transporter subunit IIA [Pasteurella atlantica]MDP8044082.1 PTS lactose/cellobiose transporter subunit IIA [Pasteurella atlantica]MDP8046060.1 PTS lactose/cellobiose transporter subunit IIA [Pasteurella atlantica]
MQYEELSELAMEIIVNAGAAKSSAMEAIQAAKQENFTTANEHLKSASQFYCEAHKAQTALIRLEAQQAEKNKQLIVPLMMVHAQDHLTMALMTQDFARELIDLYHKLEEKND